MNMIYGKGLKVFLVFCLILTLGYSLTANDIFVSLDKTETWLGGGYAIYTLKNPTITTASLSKSVMPVIFLANNTPTTAYTLSIEKNVSTTTQTYVTIPKNCTTTYYDNKTAKNATRVYDCSYQIPDKIVTSWSMQFVPLTTESLSTSKTIKVRVDMAWKLPKEVNGKYFVSRDWIPSVTLSGTTYTQDKWAWANSSCSKRMVMNFTNSWNTESLDNFPVLFVFNSSNLNYSYTYGTDVQFYSQQGLYLPKDIQIWNESGNSYIWVTIPYITASTNLNYTEMYYNCSSAIPSEPLNVWSGFEVMLHMDEPTVDLNYTNSARDEDFISTGVADATGYISDSGSFATKILTAPADRVIITTGLTIMTWINNTSAGASQGIVAKCTAGDWTTKGYTFWSPAITRIAFRINDKASDANFNINTADWVFVVATWNSTNTTLRIFGNGVELGYETSLGETNTITDGSENTRIGTYHDGSYYWRGKIDEFRMMNKSISAKRINATYLSDINKFVIYGAEENAPVVGNTVTLNYPNSGVTNTTNQIQFGYTPTFSVGNIQNCSLYTNESGSWGIKQTTTSNFSMCYQETANISTACGGLATGKYTPVGPWNYGGDPAPAYDGDWDTSTSYRLYVSSYILINYSKPPNSNNNSLWQVKRGGGILNLTIPLSCWNYDPSFIFLNWSSTGYNSPMYDSCYNGTWVVLYANSSTDPNAYIYEEAMWWNISIMNNSLNTITHNFSNAGTYLWNIACWNESDELFSASNRTLTLTEYTTGYPATGYELSKYPFNITFSFSGVTYANTKLIYNTSIYTASNLGGGVWAVNVTTPFLLTNNSEVSFYWNYTRDGVLYNTSSQTHNVTYAYFPDNSSWLSTTVLEGDSATAYLYGWNVSSLGVVSMKLFDGTSNHTASGSVSNSSVAFNVGSIPVSSLSKNYTWYMMVSSGGVTRTMTTTTANITIVQFGLIDCGSNPTLSYMTYDEQTWAYAIGSNYYARVDIWRGNAVHSYSKVVLNAPNIEWCISPASASFHANVSLLYGNTTDYPQRSWNWNNMVLSNVTQNISVYLLNTSHAFLTNIDVKNQIGIPQSNIIVLFQKFNYTEGRYINMTNAITTGAGGTFTYLEEFNTPYKILLYDRNGNLLNTYDNYFIKESPITLRTTTQFYSLFYYFNQMSATCSWDNSTKYLSCDWNDGSGKLTKIDWKVREDMIFQTTYVCNETQTGTSGTFTCYLGSLSGVRSDYYSLTAYIGDVGQLIMNGYVNTNIGLSTGKLASLDRNGGVILALFIVMFMFFIGIWKPALGIALGFAGFVLSIFLGLLDFGGAEFSIVGILLALTIFMIWRMRV